MLVVDVSVVGRGGGGGTAAEEWHRPTVMLFQPLHRTQRKHLDSDRSRDELCCLDGEEEQAFASQSAF